MLVVGKLLGAVVGLGLAGPFGAFVGAALGHAIDSNVGSISLLNVSAARQSFLGSLFGTMGHLARADGQVTQLEVALVEGIMKQLGLTGKLRHLAIRSFNAGKKPSFPLHHALDELQKMSRLQPELKNQFVEVLVDLSLANGRMRESTLGALLLISERIGLAQWQLERMVMRRQEAQRERSMVLNPFDVLGVSHSAADGQIKQAYRRLLSEYHPDKQHGRDQAHPQGLAEQKTRQIREAYQKIKLIRMMK